jgi:murein DD-endopeptidase MepM/ murein hydrolase activator NlpD
MRRCLAAVCLLLTLAACVHEVEATPSLPPPAPFLPPTPTQTPTILPGPSAPVTMPTATVFTYTVVKGDTLSSIAQKAGVTLEALLAANPGISPTTLSIGTKLVIPAGNQVLAEPTPTPAALPVRQARCWPEITGGLWCLALVQNAYAETLENLSARFDLLDSGGQEIASQVVYGLLDILPPGRSMPLAAHFDPPQSGFDNVRIQILTAIRLLPGDTRYLPVSLENTLFSLDASGRTARVNGLVVPEGKGTVNTLWVLASAYDQTGNVIGVRRWESQAVLTVSAPASFDFQISSLGPGIARVEFLAEAQP